jgi:hypothetical protein
MERLLAGATATMVFTDPPYNVPIAGHVSGLGRTRHREFSMAAGEMSKAEFTHFLVEALAAHAAAASEGAILFVCMDWRHLEELLSAARTCGLELINLCVWNKTNGGMGSLYRSKHELVVVLKKGDAPHINNIQLGRFGRYRTNVWDYAGVNSFGRDRAEDLANHPTVKPVALVADAIRDVSNRGDVVLDGFMGSGTSLLAAERTGRIVDLRSIDDEIDFGMLEAGDAKIEVEIEFAKLSEFDAQRLLAPTCLFREPVVGDAEGPHFFLVEMIKIRDRHLSQAEELGGLKAPVTSDNGSVALRQNAANKTRQRDRSCNLGDLLLAVRPSVPRIRTQPPWRDHFNRAVGLWQRRGLRPLGRLGHL